MEAAQNQPPRREGAANHKKLYLAEALGHPIDVTKHFGHFYFKPRYVVALRVFRLR